MTHTIVVESLSCVQLLCDSTDCNLPGSSAHGIFQTRILGKVAISFSRGSSRLRYQTPCLLQCRWILYHWATWEAPGLILLNNKKKNNPNKNGQKIWIHISLKKIHMANKHMKRCLTSLAIREIQIKVTRSRTVQWLGLQTSTGGGKGSTVGQGTEISQTVGCSSQKKKNFFFNAKWQVLVRMWRNWKPSYTVNGNVKCCSHFRKQSGNFSKS